jgi:hypothetical protein
MTHPRLRRPLTVRAAARRLVAIPVTAAALLVALIGFTHPDYIRSTGVTDGRPTVTVDRGWHE